MNPEKRLLREFNFLEMKRNLLILCLLFVMSSICFGQKTDKASRIEAVKRAYIEKQLNLTPEEATNLWPVYDNYSNEIRQARRQCSGDELACDEQILNIRKKYKSDFKRVLILDTRVNRIYVIDRNYRELLKQELQKRQQNKKMNSNKRN